MQRYSCILFLLLALTAFQLPAQNTVTPLPGLPADSIVEPGVKVFPVALSNGNGVLSFWFKLRAFRLGSDFSITGARYYCAWENKESSTLEPFNLTIPYEATADTAVMMELCLEFPREVYFLGNDSLWFDTSDGTELIYTGEMFGHAIPVPPSFYMRNRSWIVPTAWTAGIVFVALICLVVLRNIKRMRKENLSVRSELGTVMEHNDELNAKIESLFGERLDTLNHICNEYFEKKDAERESVKLSVYSEVEKLILSFSCREAIETIENTVDTYRNGILTRLSNQVPSLSDADILTVTYLYAGFSPKAVCVFTDSKIKNFYNRRLRIREKISASDAADKEEFLSRLEL